MKDTTKGRLTIVLFVGLLALLVGGLAGLAGSPSGEGSTESPTQSPSTSSLPSATVAPPVTTTDTQGRIDEFAKSVADILDQGPAAANELIPVVMNQIVQETGCTPQRGGTVPTRKEAEKWQRLLAQRYGYTVGIAKWDEGWVITPFTC